MQKIREMQSMATKIALLAKEAAEAHNAALAGGQTAAGVATQLLAAGAVDSEKPEAYEDKELEAEIECASSPKPWVSLKNEPRGRRRPCPPYTCKADSRAWSRIILM